MMTTKVSLLLFLKPFDNDSTKDSEDRDSLLFLIKGFFFFCFFCTTIY